MFVTAGLGYALPAVNRLTGEGPRKTRMAIVWGSLSDAYIDRLMRKGAFFIFPRSNLRHNM